MNRSSQIWGERYLSINVVSPRRVLKSLLGKQLIKLLGSTAPGLTWNISFLPVSAAAGLVKHPECLVLPHVCPQWFSRYAKDLWTFTGFRLVLGFLLQIIIRSLLFQGTDRILPVFLHFPHYFFASGPFSVSCSRDKLVLCFLVKIQFRHSWCENLNILLELKNHLLQSNCIQ